MKWSRAVHHLRSAAAACSRMAGTDERIVPLRVTQLWVAGDVLGPPRDVDTVRLVLRVDLPVDAVPWLGQPAGAVQWLNAAAVRDPVRVWWRSLHAPVWNHRIDRPLLVWSHEHGVDEQAVDAVEAGAADHLRSQPPPADELRARLLGERDVTLRALRRATDTYGERRWARTTTPYADELWRSSEGFLDVSDALVQA